MRDDESPLMLRPADPRNQLGFDSRVDEHRPFETQS
jgi:hypothetical protein